MKNSKPPSGGAAAAEGECLRKLPRGARNISPLAGGAFAAAMNLSSRHYPENSAILLLEDGAQLVVSVRECRYIWRELYGHGIERGQVRQIIIPPNTNLIPDYAFVDFSGLESVVLLPGRASIVIGESAFDSCEKLSFVFLPSNIGAIGDNAFWGCSALETVFIPRSATVGRNVFADTRVNIFCEAAASYDKTCKGWLVGWRGERVEYSADYLAYFEALITRA